MVRHLFLHLAAGSMLFANEVRGCSYCFNSYNHEHACFLEVRQIQSSIQSGLERYVFWRDSEEPCWGNVQQAIRGIKIVGVIAQCNRNRRVSGSRILCLLYDIDQNTGIAEA